MRIQPFNELLQRAKANEPLAVDQLLARLTPRLKQFALTHAGFGCAAESVSDLVQEVAVRIWKKLDQFAGSEDDLVSEAMFHQWVEQIVRNLARDMRRDRNTQRRSPPNAILPLNMPSPQDASGSELALEPAADQESPSSLVRTDEQARLIQKALQSLSDDTVKQILELRFVQGLSLRQISDRLGIGYDKVRDQYNRSLRYLESKLDELK